MFNMPEISFIKFDYSNATMLEELRRNLLLLYETTEGTCPGDRRFGLDQSFIDYPVSVAENLLALEIIEKTEIYEERVEITDISFKQAEDGNLTPRINIRLKDLEG
jgi:phage baseplate assembly protein W